MADVFTATGAKIFIGPSATSATDTAGEFAALSWTEITLVESIGTYGDTASEVTAAVIGDGRMRKAKGARNAGSFTITVFPASDDPGQLAVIAGEATYNNYAFKVVLPNRLTSGGTDEINYFRALIMSKSRDVGANDHIVRDSYNLGINSPIVYVLPT